MRKDISKHKPENAVTAILQRIGVGTGVLGPLQPLLVTFMSTTPLELTTANQVVIGTWGTVLAIANAFFLLLVLIGIIQIMLSQSTGTLTLPLSQFVPKIIVTALLMNLSFFFGQDLLIFNNLLCSAINANLDGFFATINTGARITQGQGFILYLVVVILLNVTLIRVLFQAFERLVLWNLLFVLGPLAFLCSFLPHTSSVFAFWGRMFVIVTFTQFVQFLAFALSARTLPVDVGTRKPRHWAGHEHAAHWCQTSCLMSTHGRSKSAIAKGNERWLRREVYSRRGILEAMVENQITLRSNKSDKSFDQRVCFPEKRAHSWHFSLLKSLRTC